MRTRPWPTFGYVSVLSTRSTRHARIKSLRDAQSRVRGDDVKRDLVKCAGPFAMVTSVPSQDRRGLRQGTAFVARCMASHNFLSSVQIFLVLPLDRQLSPPPPSLTPAKIDNNNRGDIPLSHPSFIFNLPFEEDPRNGRLGTGFRYSRDIVDDLTSAFVRVTLIK